MATKKSKILLPDCMIDLETLDTESTACILSIGACRFNEDEIDNDGFYRVIKIQSNIDEGRTISGSTLAWWMTQNDRAKAIFSDPKAVTLEQALDDLRDWIGPQWEALRPWGNSARFDLGILADAYGKQGTPWKFWNEHCFRMLKNLPASKRVPKPENIGAHNALFDAIAQAQHVQAIWKAGVGK